MDDQYEVDTHSVYSVFPDQPIDESQFLPRVTQRVYAPRQVSQVSQVSQASQASQFQKFQNVQFGQKSSQIGQKMSQFGQKVSQIGQKNEHFGGVDTAHLSIENLLMIIIFINIIAWIVCYRAVTDLRNVYERRTAQN